MAPQPPPFRRHELIPRLCGFRPDYIPMAPNTALLFVLLGVALAALPGAGQRRVAVARAAAAVTFTVAAARLYEYAAGADLAVDRWAFRLPAQRLGLAPVGKMA